MANSSIRFALMGYGHIGKVHETAIQDTNNAELVAIIDPEEITTNLPHFQTLDQFVASEVDADVVVIATPNGLHYTHAKAVLASGYHALVEKPVTLTAHHLEQLLHHSDISQRRLFNMLQLRFSPVVSWVKRLLEEKRLGAIYLVNVQCFWNRNHDYYSKRNWHGKKSTDGGVLFTQFSHFIDVLHFWFDELKPKDIRSFNFNHQEITEFADSGIINYEIPSGGFGNMMYTTSTYQKNFDSTITIIAENGTLQIGGQYMNKVNYCNVPHLHEQPPHDVGKAFHQAAIQDVVDALQEDRMSILDAVNARNVIKFLEVVS